MDKLVQSFWRNSIIWKKNLAIFTKAQHIHSLWGNNSTPGVYVKCAHTFKRRHDQNVHSNNTGNHPKLGTTQMFHTSATEAWKHKLYFSQWKYSIQQWNWMNNYTLKYMTPTKPFEWKKPGTKERRLYDFKFMLFKDKQNHSMLLKIQ